MLSGNEGSREYLCRLLLESSQANIMPHRMHNQISNSEQNRNTQGSQAQYSDVMTKLAALEQKVAVHEQKFLAAEQMKNDHQKHFDNIGNKQYLIDNQNKMK